MLSKAASKRALENIRESVRGHVDLCCAFNNSEPCESLNVTVTIILNLHNLCSCKLLYPCTSLFAAHAHHGCAIGFVGYEALDVLHVRTGTVCWSCHAFQRPRAEILRARYALLVRRPLGCVRMLLLLLLLLPTKHLLKEAKLSRNHGCSP